MHVELVAAQVGDRYTLNGSTPGPQIRVQAGQMLEVQFTNKNVAAGTTLHWHGVDVPNAEDGVAGVTQDAVLPGKTFTYRFIAKDPGTYWYHSHQVSHEQVQKGLFGALIVEGEARTATETVALAHTYAGKRTLNGEAGDLRVPGRAGPHLLRIINTDNASLPVWSDDTIPGSRGGRPRRQRDDAGRATSSPQCRPADESTSSWTTRAGSRSARERQ